MGLVKAASSSLAAFQGVLAQEVTRHQVMSRNWSSSFFPAYAGTDSRPHISCDFGFHYAAAADMRLSLSVRMSVGTSSPGERIDWVVLYTKHDGDTMESFPRMPDHSTLCILDANLSVQLTRTAY